MEHSQSRPPGRILALDPGRSRTGIALSDPGGRLATPLETVSLPPVRLVAHVLELIARHQVAAVVIGLPRLPSGDEGEVAALSRYLAEKIGQAAGVPVLLRDETLTSWEAEERLRARGEAAGRRGRPRERGSRARRGEVDRIAAAIILQDYLDEVERAAQQPGGEPDASTRP